MKTKSNKFLYFISLSLCLFIFLSAPFVYGKNTVPLDQTKRLAALGKVWGLLKYYHPEVGKGEIDWDAVLIAALPLVKAAEDYDSFNQEVNNLILEAGDVDISDYNPGTPATPDTTGMFKWIKDNHIFDNEVRKKLETMRKKHVAADNYWVWVNPYAGNTYYFNEKPYQTPYFPDENYRLLALYRYWNIIQYFAPYKEDIGEDWEPVLDEFIPPLLEAADYFDYNLTIKKLTTRINDGHGFTYSPVLSYHFGYYNAPFAVRYIEDQTVVTRLYPNLLGDADVQVGDVIVRCSDTDIDTFREQMEIYAVGSNEEYKESDINQYVLRGKTDSLTFTLLRNGATRTVVVPGYYGYMINNEKAAQDSQLEKWKILPGNIGYVHMGVMDADTIHTAMQQLMTTEAIIFDIRNYPAFILYDIANYLNPAATPFSKTTAPDVGTPGLIVDIKTLTAGTDNPDYYRGKVVVLVDERAVSLSEFTVMALQTAPDSTVIGSRTAGADGNISYFTLPGYITTYFSGLGIYYPDGTPTQRVGIVSDIYARPTVADIKQGRDAVLEEALQFIEDD
ncbi:MAG: hypothetical protein GY950_23140 [bacterium]|nr:hypothetical protein [bacterium]